MAYGTILSYELPAIIKPQVLKLYAFYLNVCLQIQDTEPFFEIFDRKAIR